MLNFSVDEMIYLNKNAKDVSKSVFLNGLKLHLVCNTNLQVDNHDMAIHEEVVLDMLKNLYSKFSAGFSDDDWELLQLKLPFQDLPYSDFDDEEFKHYIENTED